jgi:hypothetical protein
MVSDELRDAYCTMAASEVMISMTL